MSDHPILQVGSHVVATGAILSGFSGQLVPAIAAGLAAIWYAVQIWESRTVKLLLHRTTQEEEVAKQLLAKAAADAAKLLSDAKPKD